MSLVLPSLPCNAFGPLEPLAQALVIIHWLLFSPFLPQRYARCCLHQFQGESAATPRISLDASAVLPMASWLAIHHLFILLVCIVTTSVVSSPVQGTTSGDSLKPSVPESDITIFKRPSPLDLSRPAPYTPAPPAKINTSHTPAENVHNLTNLHLAAPRIQCDRSIYGQNWNLASCQEAWELIPTSTTRRTVGPRTAGVFAIPLPLRFLSGEYNDNPCSAIELAPIPAHTC